MNLQQQDRFYEMMTRLRNSRAASVPKEDKIVTEIVNGLIVSKPAKKIEYLSETQKTSEPEIIDLQEYAKSKAGSVPVNKLQEILRFQRSNGRLWRDTNR